MNGQTTLIHFNVSFMNYSFSFSSPFFECPCHSAVFCRHQIYDIHIFCFKYLDSSNPRFSYLTDARTYILGRIFIEDHSQPTLFWSFSTVFVQDNEHLVPMSVKNCPYVCFRTFNYYWLFSRTRIICYCF